MRIALIVIGCFLVGMGIGFALGVIHVTPDAIDVPEIEYITSQDIDCLIAQMEVARESHQDIVDNPERYGNRIKAGIDHRIWVEIYDEVILELRRK